MSINIQVNKSKTYLLPLFIKELNLKFEEKIVNTYLFLDNYKTEEDLFIILYNYDGSDEFAEYEYQMQNSEHFVTQVGVGNKELYVFKIPSKIRWEYDAYKAGAYSAFRDDKKRIILSYVANKVGRINQTYQDVKDVLFKSLERRKRMEKNLAIKLPPNCELSSIYIKEKETFRK